MINENVKVCILGATGFIGSSIAAELTSQGIDWVGITRHVPKDKNHIQAELKDKERLCNVIADFPIIVNALGSFKPNDFRNDLEKTKNKFNSETEQLVELLSSAYFEKIIHISSAGTIYGNCEEHKLESELPSPICEYGKAKLQEEKAIEQVVRGKAKFICARVSNPFGNNGTKEHGFIDVLIKRLANGQTFHTYKEACYERDFIHASDMAKCIVSLIKVLDITPSTFNIGRGKSTNLVDLLKRIEPNYPNQIFYDLSATPDEVKASKVNVALLHTILKEETDFVDVEEYINERLLK